MVSPFLEALQSKKYRLSAVSTAAADETFYFVGHVDVMNNF